MSNKPRGTCYLCDKEYSRQGMRRHLTSCLKKESEEGVDESLHLFVDGGKWYWLHLLVDKETTFEDLDQYLRSIWLECCGHLSSFTYNDEEFCEDKDVVIADVLEKDEPCEYIYDFGSSTILDIKIVGEARRVRERPILLIAQNLEFPFACYSCGKNATAICTICMYENAEETFLCEDCFEEHSCSEDCYLPVVNSPRMGVCGYGY